MSSLSPFSLVVALVYFGGFFVLTVNASRSAGRTVWLFGKPTGDRHISGLILRLSFLLAMVNPVLHITDDRWSYFDKEVVASETGPIRWISLVLVSVGGVFAAWSQWYMGSSWRVGTAPGQLGNLVTDGPFSISRNPVFLGQGTLMAGVGLAFPTVLEIALVLICIFTIANQATREETVLRSTFGDSYESYARSVPRWLSARSFFKI